MTRHLETLSSEYFDRLYRENTDPWNFAKSQYEAKKYDATIMALGERKYLTAFEIGCSIGVLTERLARKCQELEACDISKEAVGIAKKRCRHLSNVRINRRSIPADWPDETFDLIVLSEVIYYFTAQDLKQLSVHCFGALRPGGELVLVHWTGPSDYPLDGNEATELFIRLSKKHLNIVDDRVEPKYRLVKLQKPFVDVKDREG